MNVRDERRGFLSGFKGEDIQTDQTGGKSIDWYHGRRHGQHLRRFIQGAVHDDATHKELRV